ncbi:hypothetical protein ONJ23_25930, partial [Salmonella enterica subsp. enterica serovar Virginia]|nr:hypothetical protein [Salmonella enterica subsp. enterica serovar Virginia]
LVDNPEISIKIEQRFSEESQYRAVVENHEALICYLASHGERLTKSEVRLPNGVLRTTGEHEVNFQVHSEVFAKVIINVVAE